MIFDNNQDIKTLCGSLSLSLTLPPSPTLPPPFLLASVNDIVVVGPEQFYATRDRYFASFPLVLLEMFFDLHWTYVTFYSPSEVKLVAKGFGTANGITVSPDQRYAPLPIFYPLSFMFW